MHAAQAETSACGSNLGKDIAQKRRLCTPERNEKEAICEEVLVTWRIMDDSGTDWPAKLLPSGTVLCSSGGGAAMPLDLSCTSCYGIYCGSSAPSHQNVAERLCGKREEGQITF